MQHIPDPHIPASSVIPKPPAAPALITGGVLLLTGDIAALILAFIAANILGAALFPGLMIDMDQASHVTSYLATALAAVAIFLTHGHYTQRLPWWGQVRLMSFAALIGLLADGFLNLTFDILSPVRLIAINWIIGWLLLIAMRRLSFRLRAKMKAWHVPTVIVGDAATSADMLYAFHAEPGFGYQPQTVFIRDAETAMLDHADLPARYRDLHIAPVPDDLAGFVEAHPGNFYVIVLDAFQGADRDAVVAALNAAKARYAVAPSTSRMTLYEMEPRYFFGFDVMLLTARNTLANPLSRMAKRLLDIGLSGTALFFLLPAFAAIVVALKLEGHKGSIFYSGERIGENGELFKCWKFRTMLPNSDHLLENYLNSDPAIREHWEKYFKLPRDPRVKTRTARILRKSSLDEIPQLFNVLNGTMSVVGPRPILPNEADAYGDAIEEYRRVKPGITGLWQVSGRNAVSFQRRVYWDSWYVRNWSLWGDIVIILKTIPAVLIRDDGH